MLAQSQTFVEILDSTAKAIDSASPEYLRDLLLRAAIMLRDNEFMKIDTKVDHAVTSLAAEVGMTKAELIADIVCDWMQSNDFLPSHIYHEDGELENIA
ncbi:hypothetical protein C8K44_107200 [Aminobacter sp. AP02]|nr:hypothetical protein C8K44_107200 [Aminobacter sp. AP02]